MSFRYAVKAAHFNVTSYLFRKEHDSTTLMRDAHFCFNLMVMGKSHENKCLEDFIFFSPAPCYTAANLSALYRQSALKEKDRAADLIQIGEVCEELNKDLVAIGNIIMHHLSHHAAREPNPKQFQHPKPIPIFSQSSYPGEYPGI